MVINVVTKMKYKYLLKVKGKIKLQSQSFLKSLKISSAHLFLLYVILLSYLITVTTVTQNEKISLTFLINVINGACREERN